MDFNGEFSELCKKYKGPDGKLIIDDSLPNNVKRIFKIINDEEADLNNEKLINLYATLLNLPEETDDTEEDDDDFDYEDDSSDVEFEDNEENADLDDLNNMF